jgi:hypothetical protein
MLRELDALLIDLPLSALAQLRQIRQAAKEFAADPVLAPAGARSRSRPAGSARIAALTNRFRTALAAYERWIYTRALRSRTARLALSLWAAVVYGVVFGGASSLLLGGSFTTVALPSAATILGIACGLEALRFLSAVRDRRDRS